MRYYMQTQLMYETLVMEIYVLAPTLPKMCVFFGVLTGAQVELLRSFYLVATTPTAAAAAMMAVYAILVHI